jgi:hypothetical protein
MLLSTYTDDRISLSKRAINSGGDGWVWLEFIEFIASYLHKPAPTDLIFRSKITRSIESADWHLFVPSALPVIMVAVRA